MKALRTIALSTVAAVSLAGTAVADQSGSSTDWFSNWRWSTDESLLNLSTAQLIEKKKDDFFHTDIYNDYRGANFGQQSSVSIGNQTIQECEVQGDGYCKSSSDSKSTGNQNSGNLSATLSDQDGGDESALNLNQSGQNTTDYFSTIE